MAGDQFESTLKAQAEASTRTAISKNTMLTAMHNRDKIRDEVVKELNRGCSKWGIWCETLQISEVMVSSKTVFTDMQAEFRQRVGVEASQHRLKGEMDMTKQQQQHEEGIKNARAEFELKLSAQQLEADQEKAKIDEQLMNVNKELAIAHATSDADKSQAIWKLQSAKQIEKEKINGENNNKKATFAAEMAIQVAAIEKEKLETQQALDQEKARIASEAKRIAASHKVVLDKVQADFGRAEREADIKVDGAMSDQALSKYKIDQTKKMYESLSFSDMHLNNYINPDEVTAGALAGLLPGVAAVQAR